MLHSLSRQFLLTLQILTLSCVAVFFFVHTAHFVDPDMGWHIRTGEWSVMNHAIPTHDLFSYTLPDHEWHNNEWLMDVLFFSLYAGGDWSIAIVVFFLFAFIPFAWWILATKDLLSLSLVALATFIALPVIGVRPQLFSFFLLFLLARFLFSTLRRNPRWAPIFLLLPPFFLLWANLHGGFVMGLAMWGIAIAIGGGERLIKKESLLTRGDLIEYGSFAASVGATTLTPYGISLWIEIVRGATTPVNQYIKEWQPALGSWPWSLPIFLGCTGVLILHAWRRFEYKMLAVALFFLSLALLHARMVLPFFVTVMPLLIGASGALHQHLRPGTDTRRNSVINYFFLACGTLLLATLMLSFRSDAFQAPYQPPTRMVERLEAYCAQKSCGNVYSEYNFGGALLLTSPERKVFAAGYMPHWVDQNGYSPASEAIALQIDHPEAYQGVFERYEIRVAMVTPPIDTSRTPHAKNFPIFAGLLMRFHLIPEEAEGGNLANHLERAGWRRISVDEQSALYVHP